MQSPVFISYSSKDVVLANKIVEFLEDKGYPCWIAPRNITSGKDYTDMINDAIEQCRSVVLIVSNKSLKSQWVKKEISTAVSYNKLILPYRISNVEITGGWQFLLNNVQWIDASSNPTGLFQDLVDGLEQRLSTLSGLPIHTGKKLSTPLIVALSAAAVALVGGGFLLWPGSNTPSDTLPEAVSTVAVETPVQDAAEVVSQPTQETPAVEQKDKSNEQVKEQAKKKTVEKATKATKETTKVTSSEKGKTAGKETVEDAKVAVETSAKQEGETTPATVATDTAGQAQARRTAAQEQAFQKKLRMAKGLYIDGKYREALTLFDELRREKPQDREINAYIKDCRNKLYSF